MITVPRTLDEWSYDAIRALLTAGLDEIVEIEWKASLDEKHVEGKQKWPIASCACAMANGRGGFMVFGVTERGQTTSPDERIIGIDVDDFPKKLHDKLKDVCDPVPAFTPLAPPIAVPSGARFVHVVHIQTTLAPHAVRGTFYKRLPGSVEPMRVVEEVRSLLVDREEVRAKLRMLCFELLMMRDAARAVQKYIDGSGPPRIRKVDTSTVRRLHAELLPLLRTLPDITENLTVLCAEAEVFNYQLEYLAAEFGSLVRQLDHRGAGRLLDPGMHTRNQFERTANMVVDNLARHFSVTEVLRILAQG